MSLQITNVKRLASNVILEITVINDTNGLFLTGVLPGSVSATFWGAGNAGAFVQDAAIVGDGLVDSYEESKWKEVDNTNAPGVYQYSVPDAAFSFSTQRASYINFKIATANSQDVRVENIFPECDLFSTALDDIVMEQGVNLTEALRVGLSVLYGRSAGVTTTAPKMQNPLGTKDRVSATLDANGNRTATTLDGSEDI